MQKSSKQRIRSTAFILTACLLAGRVSLFAGEKTEQAKKTLQSRVHQMSLKEKAAQVLMVNIAGSKQATTRTFSSFDGAVPGAVLLFGYNIADTPRDFRCFLDSCTAAAQKTAKTAGNPFIPPLYALDNEGGLVYRTRRLTMQLPSAEVIGSQYSREKAEFLYREMAGQMRLLGLHLNLAPVAEVKTAATEAVLPTRCYSADKDKTGAYAAAAVRGMQKAGILAAVKHFPGNGSTDLHQGTAVLNADYKTIADEYAPPFADVVKAGAAVVLVSHVTVPKIEAVPFCFSKKGIALLRNELHFSGLILTDDVAMKAVRTGGASIADNVICALDAGCDMVMCSVQNAAPLIQAVVKKAQTDTAFAARLDDAVLHVLEAKKKVGVIDAAGNALPTPPPDWKKF